MGIVVLCLLFILLFKLCSLSLVDDSNRGTFTANKEIVSLVCGMLFSFLMGAVIDRFAETGKIRTAFILSAAVIFLLMLLHTLTMIFTAEKETPDSESGSFLTEVNDLVKNKNILKITKLTDLPKLRTFMEQNNLKRRINNKHKTIIPTTTTH